MTWTYQKTQKREEHPGTLQHLNTSTSVLSPSPCNAGAPAPADGVQLSPLTAPWAEPGEGQAETPIPLISPGRRGTGGSGRVPGSGRCAAGGRQGAAAPCPTPGAARCGPGDAPGSLPPSCRKDGLGRCHRLCLGGGSDLRASGRWRPHPGPGGDGLNVSWEKSVQPMPETG